jgi:hypothetical protein
MDGTMVTTKRAGFESRRRRPLLSHAVRARPARVREQWSPISTTFGRRRAWDNVSTEANDDGVAKSASTVGFVPERGSSAASLI